MSTETTTQTTVKTKVCDRCGEEKRKGADFPNGGVGGLCFVCVAEDKKARLEQQLKERRMKREVRKQRKSQERSEAYTQAYEQRRALKRKQQKLHAVTAAQRELAARELARRRLLAYVLRMQPGYLAGWVHRDICQRLEKFSAAVARQESPRLMLFMPPRHGKSLLASQHFPAWHLGHYPEHEIIQSSYSGSLALGFSRKVRAALRDPDYHSVFRDTRLDNENQNAEGWMTTKGGGYVPAGVGGAITGKGAHIFGIDDPIKNAEEAESATVRDSIWEWYTSTGYTRLAPGGGVLLIQTRWNYDDLAGRLIEMMDAGEGDQWEIIEYPAISEVDEPYRKAGEALHPDRYDLDQLLRIKKAVGPRVWSALYQQKPTPDEGDYFQASDFQYYRERPNINELVCYAAGDLAIGQKETNDWTVLFFGGVDADDNLYILDMYRGRWDSFEITEQIIDGHFVYKPQLFGLEKGQITMAMGPILEKRIGERKAYDIAIEDLPTGRRDKQARARAIQGRMRQKKVYFPHPDIAPWMKAVTEELLQFPNSKFDDIVDALAWLGLMLQDMTAFQFPKEKAKKKSWGDRLRDATTRGPRTGGAMAA